MIIWKTMESRFLAFVVAFMFILAANSSEGKRRLAGNFYKNGVHRDVLDIDKDKAEQVWNYCIKELKKSTEAVEDIDLGLSQSRTCSGNGVEFRSTLSMKRIMQKAIADLPPMKKEAVLDCLREKKFPLQILRDEGETLSNNYQKLFPGRVSIPRRSLRGKRDNRRVLRTGSAPAPAPVLSPIYQIFAPPPPDYPSQSKKKVSPVSSHDKNNNRKYIVAAIVAFLMAGLALIVLLLLCLQTENKTVEPKEGRRDEKPLLNITTGNIFAGSSERPNNMVNPSSNDFKAASTADSSLEADHGSLQAKYESSEANANGKTAYLPLPPGRTAPPPTVPPPAPPPKPPAPPAPAPPAPPKGGPRPPNPPKPSPLGPHHQHSSTGGASEAGDDSDARKTKLKPFFWDKVLASPDDSMVWHEIKAGSFQFNEEMMESLFGYVPPDKNKNEHKKDASSSESPSQLIQIIDPKKSQNLAILLKALNVTTEEVCDALKEGNELPAELIQTLLRMPPTSDEELKLRLYSGDISNLGPAERFLKAVVGIPFAFKRLESLLFVSTFQEEFSSIKESFETLEAACTELKNSRLFLKLLEAVLKTGNRMNDGTYRGGAQAFKLVTLLKVSDVKGTDGKTTLLHFVVQEILRSEGLRAARRLKRSPSVSSVKTDDLVEDSSHETEDYYRSLGLQVVSELSNGLQNVKKAAIIDNDSITESVFKLNQALAKTKDFLDTDMNNIEGENEFFDALTSFVQQSESDVTWLIQEEKRIMGLVQSTGDYFHGKGGRDEGSHLFVIVRDFLLMVDKACIDVKNSIKMPSKTSRKDALVSSSSPSSPESSSESSQDIHRRLFPAIRERRIDDDFSSDDDDDET